MGEIGPGIVVGDKLVDVAGQALAIKKAHLEMIPDIAVCGIIAPGDAIMDQPGSDVYGKEEQQESGADPAFSNEGDTEKGVAQSDTIDKEE